MQYFSTFGPIRSGKTLIGRALNMHPNITVQQEPFFFFFKLCRNIFHRDILKDDFDQSQPIETDFCKQAEVKSRFNEVFSDLLFNKKDIVELKNLTMWQQESAGNERAPKINPFLDQLKEGRSCEVFKDLMKILSVAYHKENRLYIGFTEAWCDDFIAPLLEMQENKFRCVHAIRDPRAIIASRNAGKNISKYGGKYPILFLIRHWRKSIAYSILNKKNPNYLSVRYEDLVTSPDMWFKKICDHLEIPFSDNLMHPESFIDGNGQLWKQNTNFEGGRGFATVSLDKWKEVLSDEETGMIEYLCKPEMEYFGYESTQNEYSLKDLANYVEDKEVIIEWLKPYNLTVSEKNVTLEIVRRHLLDTKEFVIKEMSDYFFVHEKVFQILSAKQKDHMKERYL